MKTPKEEYMQHLIAEMVVCLKALVEHGTDSPLHTAAEAVIERAEHFLQHEP